MFNLGRGIWPRYRNQSFPLILLSGANRENPFSFLIKEHPGHGDWRPRADLVSTPLDTGKIKADIREKPWIQCPGKGEFPLSRFPVTETLPLILWAVLYSYNEHVFKQVWMHFWSFVPKSFSDEDNSLHKGSITVIKTSREDSFQVTLVLSVSFRCRNLCNVRIYEARAFLTVQF